MFDDIEREYKKGLQGERFSSFYWVRASIVMLVAIILDLIIGKYRWLIYGGAVLVFALIVGVFFLKEYYHAHKTIEPVRRGKSFAVKMAEYFKVDDSRRIDKLITDLAEHNLRTKADIKLTLDYFQSRLPVNVRPKLLDWILTTVIALASIMIVTYDSSINTINLHKLWTLFAPSVAVALIILTPFIIAKLIHLGIARSRSRIDTSLVQDLAYIYVHFEKYQAKLTTKSA